MKPLVTYLCILLTTSTVFAGEIPKHLDIDLHFTPNQPTVDITYSATYKFLGLSLKRLATVTLRTTEGLWSNRHTQVVVPAVKTMLSLDTFDKATDKKRKRISFHNTVVSIQTMPDLETVAYIKENDEKMKPLLKHASTVRTIEIFDFQSKPLTYYHKDLQSAAITTNLTGAQEVQDQSQQVSSFMQVLSEVYHGKKTTNGETSTLQISVKNTLVTYSLSMKQDKIPGKVMGEKMPAICVSMKPNKKAPTEARTFVMWAAAFEDITKKSEDKLLATLSEQALDFSMAPIVLDIHLSLGMIRCRLQSITATPLFGVTNTIQVMEEVSPTE